MFNWTHQLVWHTRWSWHNATRTLRLTSVELWNEGATTVLEKRKTELMVSYFLFTFFEKKSLSIVFGENKKKENQMPPSRQGHQNLFKPHLSELLSWDVLFLTFLLPLSEKRKRKLKRARINRNQCSCDIYKPDSPEGIFLSDLFHVSI